MSSPPEVRRVLELSEMVPAVLGRSEVESLFTDLAFETTVVGILLRAPDSEPAGTGGAAPNLRVARDALLSGQATGVQIRYLHEGVEWWDTLMRTDAGFRVVRVRKAPEIPGSRS
jgi:hypothetical protein